MKLRGIDFGCVLDASGARGFFGEGYWYHRRVPGLDFSGSTFVAKTTTLAPRAGNMPLNGDGLTPTELKPKCIVVKPFKGVALNAVGLSGPGAEALFKDGRWQKCEDPFFLSFMAVAPALSGRLDELNEFMRLFRGQMSARRAPVGLQINLSCPNVGLHHDETVNEASLVLSHAASLGIPLMPKFSILLPPQAAAMIAAHPACDAICVSNTIPWGAMPDRIDWKGLFSTMISPLLHLGGGGLSGKPLLPLVTEWVRAARAVGLKKPINAGGGILGPGDVVVMKDAGADSVFLGSIAMLRGWRVRRTIRAAKRLFEGGTR